MDYRLLAQRACDRGEDVSAIMILLQGIKRQASPLHDLLSLLLELYTQHIPAPGTEDDIVRALLRLDEPTRTLWIQEALEIFAESEHHPLQDAFTRALRAHHVTLPSPEDDPASSQPSRHRAKIRFPSARALKGAFHGQKGAGKAPQDSHAKRSSAATPARSRLASILMLLLLMASTTGLVLWFLLGGDGDQTAIFDRQIEAFDYATLHAFEAAIPENERSQAMQERADFLEALVQVETTTPRPKIASPPSAPGSRSAWGETARLLRLYHQGSHESALGILGVLERKTPNLLPVVWSRALIEEWEGRPLAAQKAYGHILNLHPRFIQGHAALLRIAYTIGDHEQASRHRKTLATHNPHHPYLHLQLPSATQTLDLFLYSKPIPTPESTSQFDRFTQTVSSLHHALGAWTSGQVPSCRAHTQALHLLAPHFFFTPTLQGALASVDGTPEAAAKAFVQAISAPGLHASYRLALASIAPQFLTLLGAPQLGFPLTLDPPGTRAHRLHTETLAAPDQEIMRRLRPLALGLSAAHVQAHPELRAHALFTLAYVLMESGSLRDAKLLLGEIHDASSLPSSWRLRLLDVWIAYREGRLAHTRTLANQLKEEEALRLAELLVSMGLHTEHEVPALVGDRHTKLSPMWQHLRLEYALNQGQTNEVLSLLDVLDQNPLQGIALDTLRRRARARSGLRDEASPPYKSGPRGITPSLDLAIALMWSAKFDQAQQALERVLALEPKHPQANWFMALMLHRARKFKIATPYLIRANVEDPEKLPRFWRELGALHLVTKDFPRAQQAFYQEVLLDKDSSSALERLGQVYEAWDVGLGRRDFSRILESYRAQSGLKRQSGELLKWLARFHGSRRGTQEGVSYLDQAIRVAGPRADLLSEKALAALANTQVSQSRGLFLQALRKDTMYAPAHLGLAKVMEREKQPADAIRHYKEFLMLDPYHPDAPPARARLKTLEDAAQKGSP